VRRSLRTRGRGLLLAALVTAGVGITSGAVAYWMAPCTGTAATVLGSPEQLTLGPGTAQAQLSPGSDASVAVVATNENPYFVQIASLALDPTSGTGGFDVDAGHSGCDVSALHFAASDNAGAGWRVPPRVAAADGTRSIDLAQALTMDASAGPACQGATFTVHLVAGS
jgi:hypothetical protein